MKNKMLEGKIFPQLLTFALPLVIGSIFQLTYNLFDYIVLGWASNDPINTQAAIGIASPIMNIFISLFSGLCVGGAIHSSELYGKNDINNLKRQYSSFFIAFGIFSLMLTIVFLLLLEPILTISNVTNTILRSQTKLYLGVIAIGFVFCFIYNIYASVLRAVGDSFASLLFLILSCILNVGLNIIFVIFFKMEVLGVALSTLISQILSAFSIIIYAIVKYPTIFKMKINEIVVDYNLLKISASYAIASALQQIVLFVGKYLISIKINQYDATIIGAFAASSKVDDFVILPVQSFAHATAIFIAQNKGAKQCDRAKNGYIKGFSLNMIYGVIITIIIYLVKEPLLNLFISDDPSIQLQKDLVIKNGDIYLSYMCMFYFFPCITNSIQCYFRGIGKLNIVFYSTTLQITIRVLCVYILIYLSIDPLISTACATAIGWTAMVMFELPLLIIYYKSNKNLIVDK